MGENVVQPIMAWKCSFKEILILEFDSKALIKSSGTQFELINHI